MSSDRSAKPSTPDPAYTANVFGGDDPLLASVRKAALGYYEILGELGRGGMACVYLAHEIRLDRKVAIKVMLPEVVKQPGMVERFKQEARTAGKLAHPNIVPIYAVHDAQDALFFVMKYIEGRPLDSVIKELGPLPFEMARNVFNQLATALDFAHRKGVIHRDVKPPNAILDTEGFAVVTDFGIAKVKTDLGLTHSGSILGTPYYMSPEQCVGGAVTPASDQYSLGVVAYEMLTGVRPFEDKSYGALVVAHSTRMAPPILSLRPDCPPPMREAIERMMAKNAEQRYPSLRDAAIAFCAAAVQHDDSDAVRQTMIDLAKTNPKPIKRVSTPLPPPPPEVVAPPAPVPVKPSAPSQPPAPPKPRNNVWGRVAGVIAVPIVLLAAYWLYMKLGPSGRMDVVVDDVARIQLGALQDDSNYTVTLTYGSPPVTQQRNGSVGFGIYEIPPRMPVRVALSTGTCAGWDTTVTLSAGNPWGLGRHEACRQPSPVPAPSTMAWIQVGVRSGLPGPVAVHLQETRSVVLSNGASSSLYPVTPGTPVRVRMLLVGCTTWDTTVTIRAGDTLRLLGKGPACQTPLVEAFGWVVVQAWNGRSTSVYVDDIRRAIVQGVHVQRVDTGRRLIALWPDGCSRWDTIVRPVPGDTVRIAPRQPTCQTPSAQPTSSTIDWRGRWQGGGEEATTTFGGGQYCQYTERAERPEIVIDVRGRTVEGVSVTVFMTEIAVPPCALTPAPAKLHSFIMLPGMGSIVGDTVLINLVGGNTNFPATRAVFRGVKLGGGIDGVLSVIRTDQPAPLAWTVRVRMRLGQTRSGD